MKNINSNNDFILNFINESYKSVSDKINEIETRLNEFEEEDAISAWGGYGEEDEELEIEDLFGDESIQAIKDIEDEYGTEEIAPFGSTEDAKSFVKNLIKKESRQFEIEEERIANPKSKEFVNKKQNFIGSHIYGEDLGGLGKMYVAYSYGEQFPVYLNYKDKWYHNSDYYILDDERINKPTEKHKKDMKPAGKTIGISLAAMQSMIRAFKRKHELGDNAHTDVEPGEKN
jgi:hypothetical protein